MSKPIGDQLRKSREGLSLNIEQAASATRIRARYLEAIEAGDFDKLPSATQLRGFVRAYAEFLGIDGEALLVEMQGTENAFLIVDRSAENKTPETIELPAAQPSDLEPPQDAAEIFEEIGKQLLARRELLGLALEDIERHTHIRQHYLHAIETGNLDNLPSPVQGRGMLSNYAAFLGMDADALLLRFAEGLQAQLQMRRAASPQPEPEPIREREKPPSMFQRLAAPDTLVGGFIAFSLVVFVFWGIIRIYGRASEVVPTPSPPSIAEVLLATPTASETPTPSPATETPISQAALFPTLAIATSSAEAGISATGGASAAVQVYLTVHQRSFLRVLVDGEVQFEGRVMPGSAYPFSARTQVEVQAGNGAGLQVFYNGVDLGVMGQMGQIVHLVYTAQGAFTPTPTITNTPTSTAAVTASVSPAPAGVSGTPTP